MVSFESFKHNFHYFRKLYFAGGLILAVLLTGIIGYIGIEDYSLLDSFL